jgi:Anti-sigma-D factor RsdA to sigma factor binding region
MPDFGRWTSNGGDPSLNEINRVDRFFDALASNETAYSTDHAEAELAFLLSDWRDEVRDAPPTVQVTARDAAAALNGGLSRRRSRSSPALVASVAATVLCIGGFGAAVYGAGPGDTLYGMRSTFFGQQQTRDDQVVLSAQTEMMHVQQLIDQGQWQQAQDKLVALSTTVQSVDAPEQKQQLTQQFNALTYKVAEQNPAATLPPPDQPQPVLPDSPLTLLPIPVVVDTSTPTSTTSPSTSPTSPSSTSPSTLPTTPTSTPTSSSESPGPEVVLTSPPTSETPSSVGEPSSSTPTSSSSTQTSSSSTPTSPPSASPNSPSSAASSSSVSVPSSSAQPAPPSAEVTSVVPVPPASAQPPASVPQQRQAPISEPAVAPPVEPKPIPVPTVVLPR